MKYIIVYLKNSDASRQMISKMETRFGKAHGIGFTDDGDLFASWTDKDDLAIRIFFSCLREFKSRILEFSYSDGNRKV